MKHTKLITRVIALAMAALLVVGLISGMLLTRAASVPTPAEEKSGVTVYQNAKAQVDASNLAEGYLTVKYTGGKDVRIKVLISKAGSSVDYYQYVLNNTGDAETFPLTEGDGTYTIRVMENTTGSKYATAYSCKVELALRDPFLPFLHSNQYVNYTDETQAVKKAAELTADKKTDFEQMEAIYRWVIDSLTYDEELAKTVPSGYLPDLDAVMEAGKGICFDYAALMTAMLRSRNIPCKLVVGYAGKVYHAWINVYLEGTGWIDKAIYFDGKNWTLMDPTFASNANSSPEIMQYIGDNTHYTQKYAY